MKKIKYSENWEKDYLSIFSTDDIKLIQKKWDYAIDIYTELLIFPRDIRKILTADFSQLTNWYFDYRQIIERNPYVESILKETLASGKSKLLIFDYNTFYSKIISFFCNSDGLNLDSCFYCDIHPIGTYIKNNNSPRLSVDLDHFFPKSQCPLLALSLKNLIPCCQVCNSRIKGRTEFLDFYRIAEESKNEKKEIIKFLSPSSDSYNFDFNAKISVWPKSIGTNGLSYLSNRKHYKVHFSSNNIYKHEIKAFKLEQRYNSISILSEALSILDLKRKFPIAKIQELKSLLSKGQKLITEEQIEEVIFRKNYDINRHSNLLKLKQDLLE